MRRQFGVGLACALLAGCAASTPPRGTGLLAGRDPGAAVRELTAEEAEHPDDTRIQRDLGIALFESGDAAGALPHLVKAAEGTPRDAAAAYFLGRAAETTGRLDAAVAAYSTYLGLSHRGEREVRARIEVLAREKAKLAVQEAIAREKSLSLREVPPNAIAVPNFTNVVESDSLAPLSNGLAALVVSDLQRFDELRVLERERLRVLLDELEMGRPATRPSTSRPALPPVADPSGIKARLARLVRETSGAPYFSGPIDDAKTDAYAEAVKAFQADHGLVSDGIPGKKTQAALDEAVAALPERREEPHETGGGVNPATAPRYGLLLGARRFVQGSFVPLGGERIQLDAALLDTEGGTLTPAGAPVEGNLTAVLALEKSLVRQVLEALGVKPTQRELRELETLPTENFLAFLAFSRGLSLEEQGDYAAARSSYERAVQIDGGFAVARDRIDVMDAQDSNLEELDGAQVEAMGGGGGRGTGDRLVRTASWNGIGYGPWVDRDDRFDPLPSPSVVTSGNAIIIVEGDLPTGGRP